MSDFFYYYYHLHSFSFQKLVCSGKQIVIVFISYFFMGNRLIIFLFKGKINIRREPFSLVNVIRKNAEACSIEAWSSSNTCYKGGSGPLVKLFLIFRIENIYHALESKLWVFSGSGSDVCSCQFSLCVCVCARVHACVHLCIVRFFTMINHILNAWQWLQGSVWLDHCARKTLF